MAEYTYKDVIIDPEDPRVEIGERYWLDDNPNTVLYSANNNKDTEILKAVHKEWNEPFISDTDFRFTCIIRKKEPEKKYVPFDPNIEIDRRILSCRWIRRKNDTGVHEYMVTGFHCVMGSNLIAAGNISVNPKDLLEKYEFSDGEPCGKLVEVK